MSKDDYVKKITPRQNDDYLRKIVKPDQEISLPGGGGIKTIALENLQPNLSAKLSALNTNTINTSTLDRFLGPIQGSIEALQKGGGSVVGAVQGWMERRRVEKARRQAEEIAGLVMKAAAEMHIGRWQEAIRLLDKALKMSSEVYPAIYLKAICLAPLGRLDEAIRLASQGAGYCPDLNLGAAFEGLLQELQEMKIFLPLVNGIAAMMQGNIEGAISCFDITLGLEPRQPETLYYKALCHLNLGQMQSARNSAEQALRYSPPAELKKEIDGVIEVVETREKMDEAAGYMKSERYQEALHVLKDPSMKKVPGLDVPAMRAVCYVRLGNARDAEESLRELERLDKSDEIRQFAMRMRNELEYSGAKHNVESALESMKRESWREAVRSLQQAERQLKKDHPQYAVVLYYMAICHLRNEDEADAVSVAARALGSCKDAELEKQIKQIQYAVQARRSNEKMNEALSCMKSENWDDALDKLQDITRDKPINATAHFYKAICHTRIARRKMDSYDQWSAQESIKEAKDALEEAEQWSRWSSADEELRQAIKALKAQLP